MSITERQAVAKRRQRQLARIVRAKWNLEPVAGPSSLSAPSLLSRSLVSFPWDKDQGLAEHTTEAMARILGAR